MAHDGKKWFPVCRGARTQGGKDTLSLKWMTHKLVNWCVFNMYELDPCCFCRIWALRVSWFNCTKNYPFFLLLAKSFKYDKWKPILNSKTLIWLRLKERESFWILKLWNLKLFWKLKTFLELKTLTPYGLSQELNCYHVMQYPHPQCSLYVFLSAYGLKIWRT